MKITIHDVGHGACAVVTCPNGARYMIDCGKLSNGRWSASTAYAGQYIDRLIIQNLDEDHVEDLPNVFRSLRLGGVFSNPHVDAMALRLMKPDREKPGDGMRAGVSAAHGFLLRNGAGSVGPLPFTDDVEVWCYFNRFPVDFTNTNDLSVVTYFRWRGFAILFGGDLEEAGWERLLEVRHFRDRLHLVKVFVASHHGRENGLSGGLFNLMRPDIVVISDEEIRYQTQNTTPWYRNRVRGIFAGTDSLGSHRYRWVYTTRSDGTVHIDVNALGGYHVSTAGNRPVRPLARLHSIFHQHQSGS